MGWLSGYLYRKAITLTGGSDGAQTDFQLKLAAAFVTDHMQSDFDDLRFTKEDGETLIDSWLEDYTDSTSADVWVEFPSTPANGVEQTYYMYYDKSDALSNWDGAATFPDFFDDFEGSAMGSDWEHVNDHGTTTVADSIVHLDGATNVWNVWQARNAGYIAPPFIVEYYAKTSESDSNGEERCGLVDGTETVGGQDSIMMGRSGAPGKYYEVRNDGTFTTDSRASSYIDYIHIRADYSATKVEFYEDDVLKDTITTNVPDASLTPMLGVAQTVADVWCDWVFVRKYAANPPTYEFGSEENAPSGLTMAIVMHHLRQMRRS